MASVPKSNTREDTLNDSWEEVHFRHQMTPAAMPVDQSPSLIKTHTALQGVSMEKLLLEAQREWSRSSSKIGSNASSRASPKSPHSPNSEPVGLSEISTIQEGQVTSTSETNTDWIWEWSSRPEAMPPSEWAKFKHPKKSNLSMRNTSVMRSAIFSMENLPMLLLSHAATFFLGAAAMFVFLKKYCNWSAVPVHPVD